MTGAQVSLLLSIERRSRILSLDSRTRAILKRAHRVLKIGSWASNSEVISAQVLLFLLIEHGLDLRSVTFVVEVEISGRQIVLLDLLIGARARITDIKVTSLNRINEVGVRRHDRFVSILLWVHNRVRCRVTVLQALAKLN